MSKNLRGNNRYIKGISLIFQVSAPIKKNFLSGIKKVYKRVKFKLFLIKKIIYVNLLNKSVSILVTQFDMILYNIVKKFQSTCPIF